MNKIALLVCMLWCHVIDDYVLQGCLANLKQRKWWKDCIIDLSRSKYRHDYIVALICHAFSWTCSIMVVPWLVYRPETPVLWLVFLWNVTGHAVIDHLKANALCINLVQDQIMHALQIVATWVWFAYCL